MHTLADGKLLLQGVLDDPEDDLVRLAYADWLEEEGDDARAEFIRASLALAGEPGPDSLDRMTLTGETWREMLPASARADAVLWQNKERDSRVVPTTVGVRYRRGFVERVRCGLAEWRGHGPALVRGHPVTSLELTDREPASVAEGWRWFSAAVNDPHGEGARHQLPGDLFDAVLPRSPDATWPHAWHFPTREDALHALIAWAKLPEGER